MHTLCMWKDFVAIFDFKIFVLVDSERLNAEVPWAFFFRLMMESLLMKTCRGSKIPPTHIFLQDRGLFEVFWHRLQHSNVLWNLSGSCIIYNNIWSFRELLLFSYALNNPWHIQYYYYFQFRPNTFVWLYGVSKTLQDVKYKLLLVFCCLKLAHLSSLKNKWSTSSYSVEL